MKAFILSHIVEFMLAGIVLWAIGIVVLVAAYAYSGSKRGANESIDDFTIETLEKLKDVTQQLDKLERHNALLSKSLAEQKVKLDQISNQTDNVDQATRILVKRSISQKG